MVLGEAQAQVAQVHHARRLSAVGPRQVRQETSATRSVSADLLVAMTASERQSLRRAASHRRWSWTSSFESGPLEDEGGAAWRRGILGPRPTLSIMSRRWIRLTVRGLAVAYPVSLAAFAAVLTWIGESWWLSTVALYLPRVALGLPLLVLVPLLSLTKNLEWLWTQALAALVLLFPVMGLVIPTPHLPRPGAADRPHMRVLSYNINSGGGGAPALLEQIDRFAPDVIVLEEIGAVEDLIAALKPQYPTIGWAGQFLTASRYPLVARVDPEHVAFGGRARSPRFIVETFDTPLGQVTFYVVHPISPRDDLHALAGNHGFRSLFKAGHLVAADGPGLVEANSGLREAQISATMELASRDTGPCVVVGDTNLPGLSRVARRYVASLSDGFPAAGAGFGYTYPTKHPWMRIARILANDKLAFTHFEVGTSKASDHLCVVADLTLPR